MKEEEETEPEVMFETETDAEGIRTGDVTNTKLGFSEHGHGDIDMSRACRSTYILFHL